MRRFTKVLFGILLSSALLIGCNPKETESDPTVVATGDISTITSTSASISGTVNGPSSIAGVCYSESPSPTVKDNPVQATADQGQFTAQLTGLKAETKYYVRAYAVGSDNNTVYGAEKNFTTLAPGAPMVTVVMVSEVGVNSAIFKSTVIVPDDCEVKEMGFCYSDGAEVPTIENTKIVVQQLQDGQMVASVTTLTGGSSYSVRAYVVYNDNKTAYGSQSAFSTVKVLDIVSVHNTSAYLSKADFEICAEGEWIEAGVCWSESPEPTIDGAHTPISNPEVRKYDNVIIRALKASTKYYVRSYVKTATEVYYSEEELELTTAESFVKTKLMFSNDFDEVKNAGKYNMFVYTASSPKTEEPYLIRSAFQNRIYEPLEIAVEDWSVMGEMNSVRFIFTKDKAGNNIFSFVVRDSKLKLAYFNFHISIDSETDLITLTDFDYSKSTSFSKQFYQYLESTSQVKVVQDYVDYLTQAPFMVDYVRPENITQDPIGYILHSSGGDANDYILVEGHRVERKEVEVPAPW